MRATNNSESANILAAMNQEIPEEVINDILRRLPIAGCIARFRCVCRSWRTLLSDPSFILRDNKSVDSRLQMIMVNSYDTNDRAVCSFHSADTLEPVAQLVPFNSERPLLRFAGSCNGLICISDGERDYDLILWNPATSETKLLPPSPNLVDVRRWYPLVAVGFGFDSETDDYKIVRQIDCGNRISWECSYLLEVYSLRNDSWMKLAGHVDHNYPRLGSNEIPQLRKGKLYWSDRHCYDPNSLGFDSFDISSHEFEKVELRAPPGNRFSPDWKCSMNEESMVALFPLYDDVMDYATTQPASLEIWILLKYWVTESWTKLFIIMSPLIVKSPLMRLTIIASIGISRNSKFMFVANCNSLIRKEYHGGYYDRDVVSLLAYHPNTGVLSHFDLEIQIKRMPTMIDYIPSQVCMRDYYMSS